MFNEHCILIGFARRAGQLNSPQANRVCASDGPDHALFDGPDHALPMGGSCASDGRIMGGCGIIGALKASTQPIFLKTNKTRTTAETSDRIFPQA
jgi:hypothetical protein